MTARLPVTGRPSDAVVAAFGAAGPVHALPGGQGTSWRAGSVVLKPADDAAEAHWLAQTLSTVPQDGFRLADPVRAHDGRWVVAGWTATRWVPGDPGPVAHWGELFAASHAFHAAVRHVPRPALLDARTHAWARADRSTWSEIEPPAAAGLATVRAALHRLTRPMTDQPQVVHGDLSGNVLFHDGLPPAVLDVSPYWRPPVFADAIAVADGLLWHDGGADLLALAGGAGRPDRVARGLLFRLDTLGHSLADRGDAARADDVARFVAALDLLRGTA